MKNMRKYNNSPVLDSPMQSLCKLKMPLQIFKIALLGRSGHTEMHFSSSVLFNGTCYNDVTIDYLKSG